MYFLFYLLLVMAAFFLIFKTQTAEGVCGESRLSLTFLKGLAFSFLSFTCCGPRIDRGDRLMNMMWQFSPSGEDDRSLLIKSGLNELEYKHYLRMTLGLMKWSRLLGCEFSLPFQRLRSQLAIDLNFEKKLRETFVSHYIQYILTCCVILGFIGFAHSILEINLDGSLMAIMSAFYICGLALLAFYQRFWRARLFVELDLFIQSFESLRILSQVNLSSTEVMELSRMSLIENLKSQDLKLLSFRLSSALAAWRNKGASLSEMLEELEGDLVFLRNKASEKLLKRFEVGRFVSLALFVLPTFFIGLFTLAQAILIE